VVAKPGQEKILPSVPRPGPGSRIIKKYRITKRLFKGIFDRGRNFSSNFISLKFISDSTTNSLFAFVVSAKVAKRSVERNKLKRRLRHIIKKTMQKIKPGLAVIIFAKKGAEKMSFLELEKELIKLFKKAKII
jgi:ribonuclease P protein component